MDGCDGPECLCFYSELTKWECAVIWRWYNQVNLVWCPNLQSLLSVMLPDTTSISLQINFKLGNAILHWGWFCILHCFLNINYLHDLLDALNGPSVGSVLTGLCWGREEERKRKREKERGRKEGKERGREGEMNFPFPSSGLCGHYWASICTCLLSSASTVDSELCPSWLPLCSMQKVNMAHNGVGLVPKGY